MPCIRFSSRAYRIAGLSFGGFASLTRNRIATARTAMHAIYAKYFQLTSANRNKFK